MKRICLIMAFVLFSVVFYPQQIFTADEVGEWQYDDPTGTPQYFQDETANNNDVMLGSTSGVDPFDPLYVPDNPHNQASNYSAFFAGGQYAYRSNTVSLSPENNFTLSTWVKLNSLDLGDAGSMDAQDVLMSNIGEYGTSGGYQLLFGNGLDPYLVFMIRDESGYDDRGIGYDISSMGWVTNSWYHVAATYEEVGANSLLKLYVDGKLVESALIDEHITYDNTPYFVLGSNYDDNTNERRLNGSLDETIVYSATKGDGEIRDIAEIDLYWIKGADGLASEINSWQVPKIPGYASNAHLPTGISFYTVTLDADWEINDLDVQSNTRAYLGTYDLTVEEGGDIAGILELAGGNYLGNNLLNILAGGELKGYGYVEQSISNTLSVGTVKATGGTISQSRSLSVRLESNQTNAVLSAEDYSTLYIRTASDITINHSGGKVDLEGGTLKGHSNKYNIINNGMITGYGVIDDYYINNASGTILVNDPGETLTLNEGFSSGQARGIITVENGGILEILAGWNNQALLTLNGGTIIGSLMTQQSSIGGFQVIGGTNYIQNINFDGGTLNVLSNASTLQITGNSFLDNTVISQTGTGNSLEVGSTGTLGGYGTIHTDVVVDGSLSANAASTVLNIENSILVKDGKTASATSNGTLALKGDVYNSGAIEADSGNVNITGTIKSGIKYNGEFSAENGIVNVNGPIETDSYNVFSAKSNGTVNFGASLNTEIFAVPGPISMQGGVVNLPYGSELTNAEGKTISGYGTLLGQADHRTLNNYGDIIAQGGLLSIQSVVNNYSAMCVTGSSLVFNGSVVNEGDIWATGLGNSLAFNESLEISEGGSVYALKGANADLNGSILNDGQIYSEGESSTVTIADTAPEGSGRFITKDGTIVFSDGFTNENLTHAVPLLLEGGKMTLKQGVFNNVSTISGYGQLIDPYTVGQDALLNNQGTITAQGGTLNIGGKQTKNSGQILSDSTNVVNIMSDSFINESTGFVRSDNGALMSIHNSENRGTIECKNGAGHVSFSGNATGTGKYSFNNGDMIFRNDFIMESVTVLDDNNVLGSSLLVHGNITKLAGAFNEFDADQLTMQIFDPNVPVSTFTHSVTWQAADLGAIPSGLLDNLALGYLIFGDDIGFAGSDLFEFSADSIIYCFGLSILSDAVLDLGGGTIYYLRSGDVVNGITGTGFQEIGSYENGDIIEISVVPEPGAMFLFSFLGIPALLRLRKK